MELPDVQPLAPPAEFIERLREIEVELEPSEIQSLGLYLSLLIKTNEQFNLTAVTDPATAWTRHILDSLSLLPLICSAPHESIIDVGSGGGLPGIPLAIALPQSRMTLLESTGKKARFLEQAAARLKLANCRVVSERAEMVGQNFRGEHREKYDFVLSRAVGPLNTLLELTVPLAKVNGFVLAIKGEKAEQEIAEAKAAMHLLHVQAATVHPTPTGRVVVIQKMRPTPHAYPRQPGEPKRSPLGMKNANAPGRGP